MTTTNFDLAPPVKTVDGFVAVPIDIQKISAGLTFDGSNQSGNGDATLEFTTGRQNGNPVFDLRQTITEAWLDGASIPVAQLAHHDFGGGADAQLRIVESVLVAGTTHTLRVKYDLGPPQASTAGSYLPAMTWSPGPRLAFNFGFTDLGAGRYLEAWVPANLIFDQFEIVLTLKVTNTGVAHTVITNGAITPLGANQWSVAFPARFTALSPLLELRASDTVASMADTTTLPVSGKVVTIEAWKLAASPISLTTQINNLKTWLANNENSTGPYIHGNRFVAFLNVGGMEYEGGTTAATGTLRHETFHSWWARGLKPASQPDAWWDEAWTVYNDNGATGSFPFDFTKPAVELCPRNPWVRITASGSYTDGERFFKGLASIIGIANLNSLMSDFYKERKGRPATTTDIEEFLVCRAGNPQIVEAFHRFVYGFGDPSPAADLWLRDESAHAGGDFWGGSFWNSPDLWIRHTDDGGATHQQPEFGQDNWFYARVRNRSTTATARHFLVTFSIKTYAGTEYLYPTDFLPCVAAASGFNLGPGASAIVKARWPSKYVPPAGTHACWLSAVLTRSDQPVAGRHVWQHNNLGQKNLTIVDLLPNGWIVLPFVVANLKGIETRRFLLEIVRPKDRVELQASLIHSSGTAFNLTADSKLNPISLSQDTAVNYGAPSLDCGGGAMTMTGASTDMLTSLTPDTLTARHFDAAVELPFKAGRTARVPVSVRPQEQIVFGLRLSVPAGAKHGDVIRVDIVKRDGSGKNILGGIAMEIHVR